MKDFKELLQGYQDFMKVIGEKIADECKVSGRYDAFASSFNYIRINIGNANILIDIVDDDGDNYSYQYPLNELGVEENKELTELNKKLTQVTNEHYVVMCELRAYMDKREKFKQLNAQFGVAGSAIDIVKDEMKVKAYNVKLTELTDAAKEIEAEIALLKETK